MLNPYSRSKNVLKRKRTKSRPSSPINVLRTRRSTKLNLKPKDLRMRRNVRSKSSENFRRRLPIDRLKLTLLEPNVPLRRVRDKLVFVRSLSMKRDNVLPPILSRPDRDNSMRSR